MATRTGAVSPHPGGSARQAATDSRKVGLPRYMATIGVDDPERAVRLAEELVGARDRHQPVCLLQCGRASALAAQLAQVLTRAGRGVSSVIVQDRVQAQSDAMFTKLVGVSAVWVFADDLLETFFAMLATPLAFALRARAHEGLPVVGFGHGAVALGGLLLANRVCGRAQYELVSGLGCAPRVLVDGGALQAAAHAEMARAAIRSLPGLLGVELGQRGGIRVEGSRVESIGSEPVRLIGSGGDDQALLLLDLAPGQKTTIAPPPFRPFERGLLLPETLRALSPQPRAAARPVPALRQAPPPPQKRAVEPDERDAHARPGSGRRCPMCKKVHAGQAQLELAA
jgi:hypothetical protein